MKFTVFLAIVGVLVLPSMCKHLHKEAKERRSSTNHAATTEIEEVNKDLSKEFVYQGDIRLTEEQRLILSGSEPPQGSTIAKRNGIRSLFYIWRTKQVPYEIDASIPSDVRSKILAAIQVFNGKVCLSWQPRNGEQKFVRFVRKDGCWSYVGKTFDTGAQELSIGIGCESQATILHEMMHAAGFFHEQARYDRDQYVIVKYENMVDGASSQFDKQPLEYADTRGLPYDYGSVMHYGNKDFSKNGLPTIEAIGDPNKPLGQDIGFSALDIQKLKAHYDCDAPSSNVYSSWTDWTCKVYPDYDNTCWKHRQRFCTQDSLSSCSGADQYGIHTEWQQVIPCPCPST